MLAMNWSNVHLQPVRPLQGHKHQTVNVFTNSCCYMQQRKRFTVVRAHASSSSTGVSTPHLNPAVVAVVNAWASLTSPFRVLGQAMADWAHKRLQDVNMDDVIQQAKVMRKSYRICATVAPFAAVSSTTSTFVLMSKAVGSFVKLYLLLLFVRVLLSWFPNFNWENQPWLALRQVTDPYLNLFRGLVPPLLGTMDFTPLFGFLILQFLAGALDLDDGNDW